MVNKDVQCVTLCELAYGGAPHSERLLPCQRHDRMKPGGKCGSRRMKELSGSQYRVNLYLECLPYTTISTTGPSSSYGVVLDSTKSPSFHLPMHKAKRVYPSS